MTQEIIDNQLKVFCDLYGHEPLIRTVQKPTYFAFLESCAWCLDILGAPAHGLGYIELPFKEYVDMEYWIFSQSYFAHPNSLRRFANGLIIQFYGYEFTIIKNPDPKTGEKQN